jgi:hypothetical protein
MTASMDLQIGGTAVPMFRAIIQGGSHGSTGHATMTTSRTMLAQQGIDLLELAQDAPTILPVDIYLTQDGGGRFHLFGGEYLKANWRFKAGTVSIHARDWSGLLVDQKRVLTSILGGNVGALVPGEVAGPGVSTQNQRLSVMVTAIAKQFGLTPDLRLSSAPGSDPEVGTILGTGDTVLTAVPQSLWGILMRLARDTGNEVYTTPDKHLVFGAPGAGLAPLTFCWKQNPPQGNALPLLDLNIEHNPRRNLTFRVLVLSYDPATRQTTRGQAYVIGSDRATGGGGTVRAGAWSGPQATTIESQISTGPASKKNAIPLYTFHVDGLTAAQVNLRAQSIAADIAKRELIVNGAADIVPGMAPSQPVTLDGDIDDGFLGHQYYVTGYTHTFNMPQGGGSSRAAELDTSFMLLDVQPVGEGTATLTGTAE